jgi:hyperosmotically inducible protein
MVRHRLKWIAIGAQSAVMVLASGSLLDVARLADASAQQTSADNTKSNKTENTTAQKQTNASSDVEITRRIRQAVTNEKTLSTYAHNVKIITQGGMVTLTGPVRSPKEKDFIETKAAEIAGQGNVVDKMEVVSKRPSGL